MRPASSAAWIAADQTIEWKQSPVLSFANRAGATGCSSSPVRSPMLDIAAADDAAVKVAALRKEIAATGKTRTRTVIAEEPAQYVDIRNSSICCPSSSA